MELNISLEGQHKEYKRCKVMKDSEEIHSFVTGYEAHSFRVAQTPEPHFPNLWTVFYMLPGNGQRGSTFGYMAS